MRFAIWSGVATGITMPPSMDKARHVINVRNGWRPALARLGTVLDWNTPGAGNQITKLEINCHGLPGRLLLPSETKSGLVDHTCVAEFGAMLRPNLVSGALIEVLACSVAGIELQMGDLGPTDPSLPTTQYSASIQAEYWGAYQSAPTYIGRTSYPQKVLTGERAQTVRKRMTVASQYEWGLEGNGLRFCLSLAAASGGIVRASDVIQMEVADYSPRAATDAIGDWEGHVWDFYPDGKVKYRGMNLPRNQGSIAAAGDHLTTVGMRPIGGIENESPLRSQRLNRVPLAV